MAIGLAGLCAAIAMPAAAATCGPAPETIASTDSVFVGTLTAVGSGGMQGTFIVEEVWHGADLPPMVVVSTPLGQFSGAPTPMRYLVLATVAGNQLALDNRECGGAFPWDSSYAPMRPAGARAPAEAPAEGGVPVQMLFVIGAAAVLVAVSAFAFRRTRDPGAPAPPG
jgi:hypothetical protein